MRIPSMAGANWELPLRVDLTHSPRHRRTSPICAQQTAAADGLRALWIAPVNALIGRTPVVRLAVPGGPLPRRKQAYANPESSACASAISGISGVGEKPLSASARTAWASIGRAVD